MRHDESRTARILVSSTLSGLNVPPSTLGAELPCPRCGARVRLNPFVIDADWRPVAEAWAG